MSRKILFVGIIFGMIILITCGFIIYHAVTSSKTHQCVPENRQGVTSHPATRPLAKRPEKKAQAYIFTLPALLVADNTANLYAKVSGYVIQINVDIGSRVRAGDVLLKLAIPEMDDELRQREAQFGAKRAEVEALKAKVTQAQLAIQAAQAERMRFEAERDLSRITYERKVELYRGKAIPTQQLDEAKSQLDVSEARLGMARATVANAQGAERAAQADVKAAEAQVTLAGADVARLKTLIAYETITAPFDGVITRRNVNIGWFVRSAAQGAGPWLLTLDKVDRIRVVIDVPEAEAPLVRPGTPVDIEIASLKEPPFHAVVTRTATAIRSDTRTMRAEVDLKNTREQLSPGMYAKVIVHGVRLPVNRQRGEKP